MRGGVQRGLVGLQGQDGIRQLLARFGVDGGGLDLGAVLRDQGCKAAEIKVHAGKLGGFWDQQEQ